ncbi:MAG: hypothetical protein HYX67_17205 [Candidatus Melainabacteria bacterium]|nr:hypothetical protein [Candidatus Melainabacteria bacterium]
MQMKKWGIALGILSYAAHVHAAAPVYETYLESWDSNWQNVVQNLPPGPGGTAGTSYAGVTLDVGFACYDFSSAPNPSGLQFSQPNFTTAVSFVQSHGGKARISFGGASYASPCYPNYFISQTMNWPNNISTLAAGVISVVTGNNLDGVDFDIEDQQPSYASPQVFANDLITFLQAVRSGLPAGKTLSITIPAQGWNTYWFYLATGAAKIPGLIDYINFMEYDIWIGASSYVAQIEADILTYISPTDMSPPPNYSPGWGLPANLVQLGLMPGCADTPAFLSVADAQDLTNFAIQKGLRAVMTWDLNRDSGSVHSPACSTFPSNYEYTIAIRNASPSLEISSHTHSPYPLQKRLLTYQPFDLQTPPPHGAPN